MAKKKRAKAQAAKADLSDSKMYALLGALLPLIGFIIVMLTRKSDKYAMFYAKQGLVLFIAWVVVCVINMVLFWIPILGWAIGMLLGLGIFVLWIIGILYSLSGKETELPVIGGYAKNINL